MRLRIGLVMMAASSCALLMNGQAAAAQQDGIPLLGSTPDAASVLMDGKAFAASGTPFQSPLSERVDEQSRIAYPESARIQLALSTPNIVERNSPIGSRPIIAGVYGTQPQERPSLWLMGGVILLLLGYQLRRKHRFLRPHRFSAL